MLKFILFLIMFTAVECNKVSKIPDSNTNSVTIEKKSYEYCNCDLEEPIKTLFNGSGFDEAEINRDENFLEELKDCPREETINSLQILQNKHKDDFEILAKTSFLLVKLGHKKNENGKVLVSSYLLWEKTSVQSNMN